MKKSVTAHLFDGRQARVVVATCEKDAPVETWIESVFFSLGDPAWPEMDRDVAVSFWSNSGMELFYTGRFPPHRRQDRGHEHGEPKSTATAIVTKIL